MRRILLCFLICMLGIMMITTSVKANDNNVEESVCNFFFEPLLFWLWKNAAGKPDKKRVAGIPLIEAISFTTKDKRILRGYKRKGNSKGYVLVVQGNAMLADQIIGSLDDLVNVEYDYYIYDYRGYGNSEGKTRLKALVSDCGEIIAHLNAKGYQKRFLYGISMGGIIVLNAIGRGCECEYTAAVIDSSPSRVSGYGCPTEYNPVANLPGDCSKIKIISGMLDTVVPPKDMAELLEVAKKRGATILREDNFAHPFMDRSPQIHTLRMKEVSNFFFTPTH